MRYLGGLGFSMLATASVMTVYATNLPIMFISMAIFGLGIGGMMFLQSFIWADYFGRESVGSIRGLVNPINLVIGGLGAPAAGYVRDITGSYDPAWWAGVGLMTFAAVLTVATPAASVEVPLGRRSNGVGGHQLDHVAVASEVPGVERQQPSLSVREHGSDDVRVVNLASSYGDLSAEEYELIRHSGSIAVFGRY